MGSSRAEAEAAAAESEAYSGNADTGAAAAGGRALPAMTMPHFHGFSFCKLTQRCSSIPQCL